VTRFLFVDEISQKCRASSQKTGCENVKQPIEPDQVGHSFSEPGSWFGIWKKCGGDPSHVAKDRIGSKKEPLLGWCIRLMVHGSPEYFEGRRRESGIREDQIYGSCRLGAPIFPCSPLEDFDFYLGGAAGVEAEALGAADGDIDEPVFGVGAAVGDTEDLGLAVE
jgi:hypothetical protein